MVNKDSHLAAILFGKRELGNWFIRSVVWRSHYIQTTARQQDNSKAASNVVGWNSRDAPARCPGNGTIASPCPDNFAMKLCYVTYFITSIAQNTKETELVSPAETFSSALHFINAVFKPWGYPPERFLTLLVLIETLFFRILAMQHHSKILFFSHIRRNLHQMTGERERYSFNWLAIFYCYTNGFR